MGAALLGAVSAGAQSTLPQPVLITIEPCAGQLGTTAEVTISGTELAGATKLHFATVGIESKPGKKPGQFTITIGKDVACGYHDVRVVTPYGISNPRVFAVTRLPVSELKPGMKTEPGHVLLGRAVKQDHSRITFDAKKGEPLQVLCEAASLDSRMEPVLTVCDSADIVLARMPVGEPLVFTPPSDGVFTLDVQDLMFRGDAEYPFLLALSKTGASGLEHPLPLKPTESLDADMTKPVAMEDIYTGWFAARSKPRFFTFTAKKGEVRIIEVKCARLGLDADPYLVVDKMDGEKATFIAEGNDRPALAAKDEFDAGWADPSLRIEIKEDGEYRVKLRNLYPTRVPFELSVRPPGTAFQLVALPSDAPAAAKKTTTAIIAAPLWRGGVAAMKVIALRERGFTGPIVLSAKGLPPGVTSPGGLIPQGKDMGYVTFAAEANAAPWGGAVRILGKSGDVTTTACGATVIRATANTAKDPIFTRLTQEVALGVAAADSPLKVEPETAVYEVAAKGKLSVPLKITRHGFDDGFKLTALGIGDAAAAPTVAIAAKGTSGKLELDIAKLKLPAGDCPVLLQTTAKFSHKPGDDPKAKAKEVIADIHSMPFTIRVK
jgi:hypothetical protein